MSTIVRCSVLRSAAAFAVILAAPSAAGQQQPALLSPAYHPSGIGLGDNLAVADIDRDGRLDLVVPHIGLSVGAAINSFYNLHLDDDARSDGYLAGAPSAGQFSFMGTLRTATADFDGDGWIDVASLAENGELSVFLNQRCGPATSAFSVANEIDDLSSRLPTGLWRQQLWPVFMAADFDADGHQDILFAGGTADYWAGTVDGTGLDVWFGRGDGSFDPVRIYQTPSQAAPLDAKWIDWDGRAGAETLLLLGETHLSPYTVTHSLELCRFLPGSRALSMFGPSRQLLLPSSQPATCARPTAVDFVPPSATAPRRYAVSGYSTLQVTNSPELWLASVQSDGDLLAPGFVPVALPPAIIPAPSSEMQGAAVGDLDGDGELDLVALHLRGLYANGPQFEPEVVVVSGPLLPGSAMPVGVVSLPGVAIPLMNATTPQGPIVSWIPNTTAPACLHLASVTRAKLPDVIVGGLRIPDPAHPGAWIFATAVLRNQLVDALGAPLGGLRQVVQGRPLANGQRMHCGTVGGQPRPGNAAFGVSLTNAPRDAVATLHAGYDYVPFAYPLPGGASLPLGTVPYAQTQLLSVQGAQDGDGFCSRPLPIPANSALLGLSVYLFWIVDDLGSTEPMPVYSSDTLRVSVW